MISWWTSRKRLRQQLIFAQVEHEVDKLRWRGIVAGYRRVAATLKSNLQVAEQRHQRRLAEALAELDAAKAEIAALTAANENQARLLHAQEAELAHAEGRPMLGMSRSGGKA